MTTERIIDYYKWIAKQYLWKLIQDQYYKLKFIAVGTIKTYYDNESSYIYM